jgi:SAM-dependent methyltransferase
MIDQFDVVEDHYSAERLRARIVSLVSAMPASHGQLSVQDLAPPDQFHTRGLASTIDLARLARIDAQDRILDLGCGLGGPARYLAATYGCEVQGIDLSQDYVDAATYLNARTGLFDRVFLSVGNALHAPFDDAGFDLVWLQHVAMNIGGRDQLYREALRLLKHGGRLALYDVVARSGSVHFPLPWARSKEMSFLLTAAQTLHALSSVGFSIAEWHDDTDLALDWFQQTRISPPVPGGPGLGTVVGPDFPQMVRNLGRNLEEGALGILSAVVEKRSVQAVADVRRDEYVN